MTYLEKLSKAGIKPITTVIIGRCEYTGWTPMILKDVVDGYCPFRVYTPDDEDWGIEMIAPYEGNEELLETEEDAEDMWDYDRLRIND